MRTTETICENRHFRRLYKTGKSVVTPLFVLYVRKNKQECNRLGITTSKTVGKAVQRNRCRRVLREAYRLLESEMSLGFDLILVARTRTSKVSMNAVKDALKEVLSEQGMIQP
ncbi:MAG: ribonuclease P protein component [Clostridia bacterium]|nr:ribonuclease P protein component [Clostridia bacterium]